MERNHLIFLGSVVDFALICLLLSESSISWLQMYALYCFLFFFKKNFYFAGTTFSMKTMFVLCHDYLIFSFVVFWYFCICIVLHLDYLLIERVFIFKPTYLLMLRCKRISFPSMSLGLVCMCVFVLLYRLLFEVRLLWSRFYV